MRKGRRGRRRRQKVHNKEREGEKELIPLLRPEKKEEGEATFYSGEQQVEWSHLKFKPWERFPDIPNENSASLEGRRV